MQTVEGSVGSAASEPRKSLIAAAMRLAVVRSGLRRARRRVFWALSLNSTSRSMSAPLEMRPTVGTPRVTLAASPSAWKPAIATEPWRDRIDLAVGAEQRRDQQRAALQRLGVAEGRDRHVEPRALRREGGQVGRHHDGGDVGGAQVGAARVDAEALEHRLQGLPGEGRVVEGVAGAAEADDEAVADELVLAHALDLGEILDARQRQGRRAVGREHGRAQGPEGNSAEEGEEAHRDRDRFSRSLASFVPARRFA